MATTQYDILKLFEIVWNYRANPFPLTPGLILSRPLQRFPEWPYTIEPGITKQYSSQGEPYYANNLLGMEVFMPITLEDPDSQDKLQLENTVMSIGIKKTIISTPLVNRQGTVKEQISCDDWVLNIRGMIVGEGNNYPDDDVQKLKDFFYGKDKALKIHNALTAICLSEDEKVVIEELSFPEMKGIQNAQAFELKCASDLSFELIVENS